MVSQVPGDARVADIDIEKLVRDTEERLRERFAKIDEIAAVNQKRVLTAFRKHRLTEEYFAERTGYGRNDPGRETIDRIYADVFQSEAAAVRMQLVSGTHAIACALLGNLQPGDRLLCVTGDPYDTLKEVIGLEGEEAGSLISLGVEYTQIDVMPFFGTARAFDSVANGTQARQELRELLKENIEAETTLVYIQKSCGYSWERRTLSNVEIAVIAEVAREVDPTVRVFVDNCYGEFVEDNEPPKTGVDLVAGSLIKNPGGGLALTGGYIAGRQDMVDRALNRVTAPGVGGHQGVTFNQNRLVLQGLFMAPSVVSQALKGAALLAGVFEQLGMSVKPAPDADRFDIIQAISFGAADRLVNFCRAVQMWSPVNAHVIPEPAVIPGYQDPIIMAAGTFVEGATIELSADGPLRPPFTAFLQGGLTYLHVKCMMEEALSLSMSGELPFF